AHELRSARHLRHMRRRAPTPTLLPYTTLCRSNHEALSDAARHKEHSCRTACQRFLYYSLYKSTRPSGKSTSITWSSASMPKMSSARQTTRLNSTHVKTSYAGHCLKEKARAAEP